MKSLRLHGVKSLQIHHDPDPIPGDGETLLQVKAVGICGSDLHWFEDASIGDSTLDHPLILGHEFAALTPAGQLVAVDTCIPCGQCRLCQEGNPNLCPNHRFAGHGEQDGAMRDKIAWPDKLLFPLPEALNELDGVMLEPLGIAIHAADLGHIKPGYSVGVFGCGPIGLLIIQMARLMGAIPIIATDKLTHRLVAARDFGATHTFQVEANERDTEILTMTGGDGLDIVFEAAGENSAVQTAVAVARPGAQVVLAGIPADDQTSFSASISRRKGLTFRVVRRMKHTYPRAIRLVENRMVEVRSLVTQCFPMGEYDQAFRIASRRDGIKIVLLP